MKCDNQRVGGFGMYPNITRSNFYGSGVQSLNYVHPRPPTTIYIHVRCRPDYPYRVLQHLQIQCPIVYSGKSQSELTTNSTSIIFNTRTSKSSKARHKKKLPKIDCTFHLTYDQGNHLMTPSNVTNAIAFTGNALRKHGVKPLQNPLIPALPSQ